MEEKIIYCIQCEAPFTYSVIEQERAALNAFSEPLRCPNCRKNKSKSAKSVEGKKGKKHRRRTTRDEEDVS